MTNETHNPQIDITTLAWETAARPRDTLPFDPEMDITQKDWRSVLEEFHTQKTLFAGAPSNTRQQYLLAMAPRAANIILLSPQRTALLGLDNIPRQKIESAAANLAINYSPLHFPIHLADVKTVFHRSLEQLGLTPGHWQTMQANLELKKEQKHWHDFLYNAYGIAILDPSKTGELGLDEETKQNLFQHLKSDKAESNWNEFVRCTAKYKVLFPQDASRVDAELDQDTWQQLKTDYANHRHHPWELSDYAVYLAICAAKKVEITDHGIELVFDRSEPFTKETPALPVARKF